MRQWTRCFICLILLAAVLNLSGCSLLKRTILPSDTEAAGTEAAGTVSAGEKKHDLPAAGITKEEDERIKSLIRDYFSSLYSRTPLEYAQYSMSGTVPAWIKDFISKGTFELENGNPEIGIHMPRFVEINGLMVVDYKVVKNKGDSNTEIPDIDAGFMGMSGDTAHYFVKLALYGRCVRSSNFASYFSMNPDSGVFEKKDGAEISESNVDYIRVRVKYDVEVRKDDGNYKLVSARESSTTPDFASRMLFFNNDFIERLSYLNIGKKEDGKGYISEQDGKIYEEEKDLIKKYFGSLVQNLDDRKMKLMQAEWNKSPDDFKAYLEKAAGDAKDEPFKLTDLMLIRGDYRIKFDILSMPLQLNMEWIKEEFKSFEVIPHPGYTKIQKKYLVMFDANVKRINGTIDSEEEGYRYDYYVTLQNEGGKLKISSVSLNSCSRLDPEK